MREISSAGKTRQFQLSRHDASGHSRPHEVLRFLKSERMLHWAIAVPFVVCWVTALVLVLVYNPDPTRPYRPIFSLVHRISAVCLIVLPMVALLFGRKEHRIHLENLKTALSWSLNDFKWLVLMIPAALSKKIVLPEQGKFNAAEKVNFTMVMISVPLLISSGVLVWMGNWAWAAWLVHAVTAILATPTMLGHIYMATVNPETRIGIKGMITGYVDHRWAAHHYALWFKERFEKQHIDTRIKIVPKKEPQVQLICPRCTAKMSVRWGWLLPRIVAAVAVFCPSCGEPFSATDGLSDPQDTQWGTYLLKNEAAENPTRN